MGSRVEETINKAYEANKTPSNPVGGIASVAEKAWAGAKSVAAGAKTAGAAVADEVKNAKALIDPADKNHAATRDTAIRGMQIGYSSAKAAFKGKRPAMQRK